VKFILAGLGNWFSDYSLIENAVVEADKLGFDGALMPDHYMWGETEWMRRADANSTLETWIALSYLAGKTEQIKLGTLVTPIPFRPPSLMAKMVSTLDVISEGRVIFGVGAGWSQVEFDGYSEWNEPKVRVDKTEEGLKLMIKLWTQNEVSFKGQFYHAKKAVLEPKPVQQPYPQLLFGGRKPRMLRMAGKYGDIIFIPQFGESESYAERKKIVINAAKKAKRVSKIAFMEGPMMMGDYNSEEFIKHVEDAKESGATYFLTSLPRNEKFIESIKSFAEDVIPSFK
jgi:alkanesulfonate monooxygenase SsuD/methylene tetrahydromethanopterin reductase-like flavin-dependent oxidoreductase (luciferase family)